MKKITVILIVLFIFSAVVPLTLDSKDTTKAKVKKTVKKSVEISVDPTVYVKENGKKYHRRNCKLVSGKKGIKLSEAEKKGYEPCKVCFDSKVVYITENGKKYHKKSCEMIKNSKEIWVGVAELKGYEPCKICFPPKKDIKKVVKNKSKK